MAKRTEAPETLRSPRIDWNQWADGEWWELRQGEDFTQLPSQALKAFRNWGHRHGRQVHGSVTGPRTLKVRVEPAPRPSPRQRRTK